MNSFHHPPAAALMLLDQPAPHLHPDFLMGNFLFKAAKGPGQGDILVPKIDDNFDPEHREIIMRHAAVPGRALTDFALNLAAEIQAAVALTQAGHALARLNPQASETATAVYETIAGKVTRLDGTESLEMNQQLARSGMLHQSQLRFDCADSFVAQSFVVTLRGVHAATLLYIEGDQQTATLKDRFYLEALSKFICDALRPSPDKKLLQMAHVEGGILRARGKIAGFVDPVAVMRRKYEQEVLGIQRPPAGVKSA